MKSAAVIACLSTLLAMAIAPVSARVGRSSGYNRSSGVGEELCNLPWTMHNYWLQYRYSMDDALLRRLFPMLKRTTNYYLHLLKEGPDGKLHITRGLSPECSSGSPADRPHRGGSQGILPFPIS